MPKWIWNKGRPEWHPKAHIKFELRDGTRIHATYEDCDGDMQYWAVYENDVLVAFGETTNDTAMEVATRVICVGATKEQRLESEREIARRIEAKEAIRKAQIEQGQNPYW